MQYGFVIDQTACIGCHACTVACKTEHDVPLGVNRTWVKYIEAGNLARHQAVVLGNEVQPLLRRPLRVDLPYWRPLPPA